MTSTPQEHGTWTAVGAGAAAQKTYASISKALEEIASRRDIEVFLQGSYANSTNIRADSDVDIVVMTRQSFTASLARMGPTTRAAWDALPAATYKPADLRSEVLAALRTYYGSTRVHPHNKCIKVDKRDGYVDADVVPCLQYRWLPTSETTLHQGYVEGVSIQPADGGHRIINFPKEHIANGAHKNSECNGRYKKTVRQIKRLRNRAADEGRLKKDDAPGYLLECMTYNAPVDRFVSDDSERLRSVVLWLKFATKSDFWSCDGIHKLFQADPGGFDAGDAQRISDALWDAI